MHLFFRKILLAFSCFFVFSYTNGQINFYSVVSPKEIGKDEYFTYKIVVENTTDIQNITPPLFKNFNILSGPTSISGMNSFNGQTTQYVSLEYELQPKLPGKFTIDRAMAIIGHKVYKSNPVTLLVKNILSGNSGPQNSFSVLDPFMRQRPISDFNDYIFHKGDSLAEKVNKNMEFRSETDKQECYVGEPIVASYKLYTRLKSESKLTQSPAFTGFSVIYMQHPDLGNNSKGKINGKDCNMLTICKAQLYPLQPGVINLESAELENDVQFIKEDYAKQMANAGRVFDDFPTSLFPPAAVVNQSVTLKTKPINITVKPLPEKDKPASFNGAVGNFTMDASLQKPLFSTDEAGKLTITISGSGNMQLLTTPDIDWPKGIESFDPKVSDNLVKETVPVSGNKKFEYSFSANDTGHYILPSIRFSYFNPATATYQTINTEPLFFQVTKGNGHPFELSKLVSENERPSFINRIFYHRWWIIIFIAVVMLTGLIAWLIKDRRGDKNKYAAPRVIKEEDMAMDHIIEASALNQKNVFSETEKCLTRDDCFGFYTLLNTELKNYLAGKFPIDPNTINSNSIISVMDKKGVPNDLVLELQKLMQEIEWQLYTPFERNEKMNELYQHAHEIVHMLNAHDLKRL